MTIKDSTDQSNIEELNKIAQPLLAWYDNYARMLPWRSEPEPYRVWVSEMMLQQTQVKTVLPYFERFMEALPDIAALASVDETELLKLWEGLGYYSRARNLQRAARMVMEQHQGQLPASYEQLLKLPGIGEYSAGAIGSIAFNIPVPVVDGNVLRVLARLMANTEDIGQSRVRKAFREVMTVILPHDRPGDFNQAMMELGATVCLPSTPRCPDCPVHTLCKAKEQNRVQEFPFKTPKAPRRLEQRTIILAMAEGKVLLKQRPKKGLLASLWEPINLEGWMGEDRVTRIMKEWGIQVSRLEPLEDGRHVFTHIEWLMQGYRVHCIQDQPPEGYVWVDVEEIESKYAVPGAFKMYMKDI